MTSNPPTSGRLDTLVTRWSLGLLSALLLVSLLGPALSSLFASSADPEQSPFSWWLNSTRQVMLLLVSVGGLSLVAGLTLGALVANGPPTMNTALIRLLEISGALPSLVVVALWRLYAGRATLLEFALVLAALKTIEAARLVQERVERIHGQGYVLAALALGASERRIFFRHVLPQLSPMLAKHTALTASSVVSIEASLSFIGLGFPNSPTWGSYLGNALVAGQEPGAAMGLALGSVIVTILALHTLAAHFEPPKAP